MQSSLPMPIRSMAAPNSLDEGSMCGAGLERSLTSSMSRKRAPGMCASRYSPRPLRPEAGICQLESTTMRSGSPRCSASHSVETSGSMRGGHRTARRRSLGWRRGMATQADIRLHPSWLERLQGEFAQPYMAELKQFLLAERERGKRIFPKATNWFRALDLTPLENVRVVILGQDPYHGPGQ